jgi:hypothetical protein
MWLLLIGNPLEGGALLAGREDGPQLYCVLTAVLGLRSRQFVITCRRRNPPCSSAMTRVHSDMMKLASNTGQNSWLLGVQVPASG